MKRKIDFFIVGTPKGGTTALSFFLNQHPDIFFPEKEVPYFSREELYKQGEQILASYYKIGKNEKIWGGVDVTLLYFLHAAQRMYEYHEDMKIIAVLRNPVDRAYSAYWYAKRFGWENSGTFEIALGKEEERSRGSLMEQAMRYLPHGHYITPLKHYMKLFGEKKVKVILNDDLKKSPEATIQNALKWLGVDESICHIDGARQINKGGMLRFEWLQKLLYTRKSAVWQKIRKIAPPWFFDMLFVNIKRPLVMLATKRDGKYPPMMDATRKKLQAYYKPWNLELSQFLKRDLSHWNR